MPDRGLLSDVADAVALQQEVDWARCAEQARPAQRHALDHLRTFAGICRGGGFANGDPGETRRRPSRVPAHPARHRRAGGYRPAAVGGRDGDRRRPAAGGLRGDAGGARRAGHAGRLGPGIPAGGRHEPVGDLLPPHPARSLPAVRAGAADWRPVRSPGVAAGRRSRLAWGVLGAAGGRRARRRPVSRAAAAGRPLAVRAGVSAHPPADAARRCRGGHGGGGRRGGGRAAGGQPCRRCRRSARRWRCWRGTCPARTSRRFSSARTASSYWPRLVVLLLRACRVESDERTRTWLFVAGIVAALAPHVEGAVEVALPGTVNVAAANWISVLGSVSTLAVPCLTMYAAIALRVLDVRTTVRVSARRLLTRGGLAVLIAGPLAALGGLLTSRADRPVGAVVADPLAGVCLAAGGVALVALAFRERLLAWLEAWVAPETADQRRALAAAGTDLGQAAGLAEMGAVVSRAARQGAGVPARLLVASETSGARGYACASRDVSLSPLPRTSSLVHVLDQVRAPLEVHPDVPRSAFDLLPAEESGVGGGDRGGRGCAGRRSGRGAGRGAGDRPACGRRTAAAGRPGISGRAGCGGRPRSRASAAPDRLGGARVSASGQRMPSVRPRG